MSAQIRTVGGEISQVSESPALRAADYVTSEVKVTGADFDAVTRCLEKDGEVEGWAASCPLTWGSVWWRRR